MLFKTYLSNIYCKSLWTLSTKLLKQAEVAHNDCFRALFKIKGPHSLSELFCLHNILNLREMQIMSMQSLM